MITIYLDDRQYHKIWNRFTKEIEKSYDPNTNDYWWSDHLYMELKKYNIFYDSTKHTFTINNEEDWIRFVLEFS